MYHDPYNPDPRRRIEDIDMALDSLSREREQLIRESSIKPLEPKDAALLNLAHKAGQMEAMYRAEAEVHKSTRARLEKAQEQADRVPALEQNRDAWKERALSAELKHDKLKKARAKKRKR